MPGHEYLGGIFGGHFRSCYTMTLSLGGVGGGVQQELGHLHWKLQGYSGVEIQIWGLIVCYKQGVKSWEEIKSARKKNIFLYPLITSIH